MVITAYTTICFKRVIFAKILEYKAGLQLKFKFVHAYVTGFAKTVLKGTFT